MMDEEGTSPQQHKQPSLAMYIRKDTIGAWWFQFFIDVYIILCQYTAA